MSDKYLILENGMLFKGKSFGYDTEVIGELVFTTKTNGYLETLSDQSYYGQIVLQTFPLIGNYGFNIEDFGPGPLRLRAYIVRQWCSEPSNFRCEGDLDTFLHENKVPGLYDIDTRALTRILRDYGTMNAMISDTPELSEEQWRKLRSYKISGAVNAVCADSNFSPGNYSNFQLTEEWIASSQAPRKDGRENSCSQTMREARPRVVMWDFGDGFRSSELLLRSGLDPVELSYLAGAGHIFNKEPDGIYLTGGPGDPAENNKIIEEIRKLCVKNNKVPILAVGLGHQMLALAQGAKTEKMKFGHRGANQPVQDILSSSSFVTDQNHGYTVTPESLPDNAQIRYRNINDGTCEGIDYLNMPAFSVQFEPTDEIINRFNKLIKKDDDFAAK